MDEAVQAAQRMRDTGIPWSPVLYATLLQGILRVSLSPLRRAGPAAFSVVDVCTRAFDSVEVVHRFCLALNVK